MTQALTNPAFQLPAHLQDFGSFGLSVNQGITGGIKAGGHPRINLDGCRWRVTENGVEDQDYIRDTVLDVIIVDANPHMSKVYYASKFIPGTDAKAPDCFSDNGEGPSTQATNPQHSNCAVCPHNAWGSKVNELGNKTKACSDYKKIAVVLADDPERNVFELRIPAASLQDFNKIMSSIVRNNLPIPAIVFELTFDTQVTYPRVLFKPKGYVAEDQAAGVKKWLNSADAKLAVGANDVARKDVQDKLAAQALNTGTAVNYVPQPQANPHQAHAFTQAQTQAAPPQRVPEPADPLAALGQAPETPKRRGRPAKAADPATQGKPAPEPTGQMTLDLPGVQAPAQATPINPQKTNADLDALLAGVL